MELATLYDKALRFEAFTVEEGMFFLSTHRLPN